MTPAITRQTDVIEMHQAPAHSDRPGPTLVPSAAPAQPASRPAAFPLDQYLEFRRLLAESDLNGAIGE